MAAVQHLAEARTGDLIVGPPDPKRGEDIDAAVETMWATYRGPLFAATIELWVASRTNAELREVLQPEEHRLAPIIRDTLAAVFGTRLAGLPQFREFSSLLWSSMRGVAMTYTFEPRDHRLEPHLAVWKRLAHTYLDPAE